MKPVISYEADDGKRYRTEKAAEAASIRYHVDKRLQGLLPPETKGILPYISTNYSFSFNSERGMMLHEIGSISHDWERICKCMGIECDLQQIRDYRLDEKRAWWKRWRKGATQ